MTNTLPPLSQPWRFPELAVRMRWSERVTPAERARLVAHGIAERYTPRRAVERLIADGEFAVADAILDEIAAQRLMDEHLTGQLLARLRTQRRTASDDAEVRARLLADRADRIGLEAVDVGLIAAEAVNRRSDAAIALDDLDLRIREAEDAQIERLHEDLTARVAPSAGASDQAWAEQVRTLLAAREILAARQVLAGGAGSWSVLPVEEPVADWPWRAALDEVLAWFEHPDEPSTPAQMRDYVLDDAGEQLIAAIRRLQADPDTGRALLAAAIHELIGTSGPPARPRPRSDGSTEFTLLVPDDFRLPPVVFGGRETGLHTVIGGTSPSDPDPGDGPGSPVWFANLMSYDVPSGPVAVTLTDLLSLLQTERTGSGRPRPTASRRMGLIRLICRRLPVTAVVRPDAFAGRTGQELRHQLWWLLHALGMAPDGVTVDTLLYESGGHSRILVHTLDNAVDIARRRSSIELDPQTFVRLRTSAAYRETIERSLHDELGDAGVAALFTMVFFSSANDLPAALETFAGDARVTEPMHRLMDVTATRDALYRAGYLVDGPDGVALCECGMTRLLRRGDPQQVAVSALRRLAERAATAGTDADERLREEQYKRKLVEIDLHAERRRATAAREALTEARAADAGSPAAETIRRDRDLRDERQKVDVWRRERVDVDLAAACGEVCQEIESFARGVDLVRVVERRAVIVGSRMALRIALENLIHNAVQAVTEHRPPGERDLIVTVGADPADPTVVTVDIEDNGPGLPADIVAAVVAGSAPRSTRHQEPGEGLLGTQVLVRDLGGSLRILPPSARLGGAHLQCRFPARPDGS